MIDCAVVQDLLPLYLDNECSSQSRTLIEEHLKNCDNCRRVLKNLEKSRKIKIPREEVKYMEPGTRFLTRYKYKLLFGAWALVTVSYLLFLFIAIARTSHAPFTLYLNWFLVLFIYVGFIATGIFIVVKIIKFAWTSTLKK